MDAREVPFVQPVHAIQALDNSDTPSFGCQQPAKMFAGANHQDRLRVRPVSVMVGGNAQRAQTGHQFVLKGGWPAGAF